MRITCVPLRKEMTGTASMLSHPAPSQPFDTVRIDLLKLHLTSSGNQHLFVCMDHFSHFSSLSSCQNKSSQAVSQVFVNDLIWPFTFSHSFQTMAQFNNEGLSGLCSSFHVTNAMLWRTILVQMAQLIATLGKFLPLPVTEGQGHGWINLCGGRLLLSTLPSVNLSLRPVIVLFSSRTSFSRVTSILLICLPAVTMTTTWLSRLWKQEDNAVNSKKWKRWRKKGGSER